MNARPKLDLWCKLIFVTLHRAIANTLVWTVTLQETIGSTKTCTTRFMNSFWTLCWKQTRTHHNVIKCNYMQYLSCICWHEYVWDIMSVDFTVCLYYDNKEILILVHFSLNCLFSLLIFGCWLTSPSLPKGKCSHSSQVHIRWMCHPFCALQLPKHQPRDII